MATEVAPRRPYNTGAGRRIKHTLGDETASVSEKTKIVHEEKEEVKVEHQQSSGAAVSGHDHKHDEKHSKDAERGYSWVLWAVLLFIVIFLIVAGCFHVAKPTWCSKPDEKSSDGKNCLDLYKALLWAFFITLILVILIGAAYYACC